MLSVEYLGAKLKDIKLAMDTTPQTPAGREYLSHLGRLKEAYDKEFNLALKRPKKRKINPEERWAYYRKGIEPSAQKMRGY